MSQSGKHFKAFKPHSKHKLMIFEHYFDAWAHKHGMRAGAGDRILYVDACAGRGADDLGNHGSPLIAAVAAAEAQSNVSRLRKTPFRIQVVAIEKNRKHHAALAKLLAEFGDSVRTLRGTLEENLDGLNREFPQTPSLYFVDPFGMDPLQAELVRQMLEGKSHEVLLLFADQAALRHFGAIVSKESRTERKHRRVVEDDELALFPDENKKWVASLEKAAVESGKSRKLTGEHAKRILNAAFGDTDWLAEVDKVSPADRRRRFLSLYSDRLVRWGASHVLQIPIIDATNTHAYTLIHASKTAKAYTTMKEAVTHALKMSPLPDDVVEHMKWLVESDIDTVETAVCREFASKQVRWAEDERQRTAPCVKQFVLETTGIFPFELPELKARLQKFRTPGSRNTLVYSFSERPSDVD